ncbi:MAG: response regulator [Eubacterium sp.]
MTNYTVLIVEDEANITDFMKRILSKYGYKVITARNGSEGLSLITSQCPDIILLDLGLPDIDGNNIISSVRKWSLCPIIVVSARESDNDKVTALEIVAFLAQNSGKVMTYSSILKNVWGPYMDDDNKILRVNMANIRRKLERNPAEPVYILTELGIGYRMIDIT